MTSQSLKLDSRNAQSCSGLTGRTSGLPFCDFSYHVKSVALVGSLVTVIASISIPCSEGVVTREATGCEDSDAKGYGDACSNAEAMALKRAAAKFGLGLHLYQK